MLAAKIFPIIVFFFVGPVFFLSADVIVNAEPLAPSDTLSPAVILVPNDKKTVLDWERDKPKEPFAPSDGCGDQKCKKSPQQKDSDDNEDSDDFDYDDSNESIPSS